MPLQADREALTIERAVVVARKARKKYEKGWRRYRREFTGEWYREGEGNKRYTNYCYLFAATYLPQLADSPPVFGCKSELEHTDWLDAEAHRLAVNKIVHKTKLLEEYRLCALDSFYAFGFGKTGLYADVSYFGAPESPDPGNFNADAGSFEPTMPFFQRISPFDALWDDMAEHPNEWNYAGHEFRRSQDAVMADPRYDLKELEQGAADGYGLMDSAEQSRVFAHFEGDVPPFYKMVELWVRPTNTLYTLIEISRDHFAVVRKIPFYGRKYCGPFRTLGYIFPPGKSIPLAPAVAWMGQYIELECNEHQANLEAQAEKRFVNFPEHQGDAAKIAHQAKHNGIVVGAGDGKETLWGGVTEARLVFIQHERQHLERSSGISDVNLGISDESSTATGASLVNSNKNRRIKDMQRAGKEFIEEIAEDFKFYVHNEPSIQMNVTMRTPEGLPSEYQLDGGPKVDPATGAVLPDQPSDDAFRMYLEDGSLFPSDDSLERMEFMQSLQTVTTTLLPMLQMQGSTINAVSLTRDAARKLKWPELEAHIIPMTPMGAQFGQMAEQEAPPGAVVNEMATTAPGAKQLPVGAINAAASGQGGQSAIQNSPRTNKANSDATKKASPQRRAMTAPGANNKETNGG